MARWEYKCARFPFTTPSGYLDSTPLTDDVERWLQRFCEDGWELYWAWNGFMFMKREKQ